MLGRNSRMILIRISVKTFHQMLGIFSLKSKILLTTSGPKKEKIGVRCFKKIVFTNGLALKDGSTWTRWIIRMDEATVLI